MRAAHVCALQCCHGLQLDKESQGRALLGRIHDLDITKDSYHATITHESNLKLAAQQAKAGNLHPATGVSIDATRTEATYENRPLTLYAIAMRNTTAGKKDRLGVCLYRQ